MFLTTFAAFSQQLAFSQKRECRRELRKMVKRDQVYRLIIVKENRSLDDTLWRLQTINDSINLADFTKMTEKYGYPSLSRVGMMPVVLLLHFTLEPNYLSLRDLFEKEQKKGNMPAWDYAVWFDRCMVNMKQPTWYGEYGRKEFTAEEKVVINANRKAIGLPEK